MHIFANPVIFGYILSCLYLNSSGKFHTINSQNGVVAQAMLVMQLLESLPTCTATIKKIHQLIYGSGDPVPVASLVIM